MATLPTWRPTAWNERREKSLRKHILEAERFTWIDPELVVPSTRMGHVAVYENNCLYVHGGCSGGNKLGDVLCINLETKRSTVLVTTGEEPGQREGHSAFLIESTVFIFGGTVVKTNGSLEKTNDLLYLDLKTLVWTKPRLSGDFPLARDCHSGTLDKHNSLLLVFGGRGGLAQPCLQDLYVLNLKSWKWSCPAVSGPLPKPRRAHSAVMVGDRLFIVGGDAGDNQFVTEVNVLNVNTYEWSKFSIVGDTHPPPRAGHSCFTKDDKIYIFGGIGRGGTRFNDLWVLHTRFAVWVQIDATGAVPRGRFLHSTTFVEEHGPVLFYGGCSNTTLGEVLILDTLGSGETLQAAASLSSGNFYSCECPGCRPSELEENAAGAHHSPASSSQTVPTPHEALHGTDVTIVRTSQEVAALQAAIEIQVSQASIGFQPLGVPSVGSRKRSLSEESNITPGIFGLQEDYQFTNERRSTSNIMAKARRALDVTKSRLAAEVMSESEKAHTEVDMKTGIWRPCSVDSSIHQPRNIFFPEANSAAQSLQALEGRVQEASGTIQRGSMIRDSATYIQDGCTLSSHPSLPLNGHPNQQVQTIVAPLPALGGITLPTATDGQDQSTTNGVHTNHAFQSNVDHFQGDHLQIRPVTGGVTVQARVVGVFDHGYLVSTDINGELFQGVLFLQKANSVDDASLWNKSFAVPQQSMIFSPAVQMPGLHVTPAPSEAQCLLSNPVTIPTVTNGEVGILEGTVFQAGAMAGRGPGSYSVGVNIPPTSRTGSTHQIPIVGGSAMVPVVRATNIAAGPVPVANTPVRPLRKRATRLGENIPQHHGIQSYPSSSVVGAFRPLAPKARKREIPSLPPPASIGIDLLGPPASFGIDLLGPRSPQLAVGPSLCPPAVAVDSPRTGILMHESCDFLNVSLTLGLPGQGVSKECPPRKAR